VAGKLNVFRHDGNMLGVNGAQVGVLKEANEVGLHSLLNVKDSGSLETEVALEILSSLMDETLKGSL
jgi:hypothetical protein